jgi:predicted CXXCH cytochrome family protein
MEYKVRIGLTIIYSLMFLLFIPGNGRVWSFDNKGQNSQAIESHHYINASIARGFYHFQYESDEQCSQCHPRLFPSHMFFKPFSMSENLPLDLEGNIRCITCHNCLSNKCELRRNKAKLCMICHDCMKGMSCIIGVAHLGNSDNNIDQHAHTCLACHDGVIGPSKNAKGLMVNKHYRFKNGFRDISNTGIIIVDGIITCTSCHNPYKSKDKRLVVSNKANQLCSSCHKK